MTLLLVDPDTGGTVRELSPRLEDCVRAGKEDWNATPGPVRRASRRTLAYAHRKGLRIRCGCGPRGPVLGVRRLRSGRYVTVNLAKADGAHSETCPFRRGRVRTAAWIPGGKADLLDLSPGRASRGGETDPDADRRPYGGPPGVSRGTDRKTPLYAVRKLLQRARLNRLEVAGRHPEPRRWLAEIERAAGTLRVAADVPASDVLFTDPERWRAGDVHRRLDAAARKRRRTDRPFALLCWPAVEAGEREIDPRNRNGGYVKVRSRIVRPATGRYPVRGPYLFLGVVARPEACPGLDPGARPGPDPGACPGPDPGDGGGWECVEACVQPVAALDCPVPVDSGHERAAVAPLRTMARSLRGSPLLNEALGGAVRVEIEKPLTPFAVRGGPCVPDFLVTVVRPGAAGHVPGAPEPAYRRGRERGRDRARYVVEVMGRNDPEYEASKERTHPRMARIGRVFRIEARDLEAPGSNAGQALKRRCLSIAVDIAEDLVRKWGAG